MRASARRGGARSLRLKLALWFLAVFSILHALLLVAMVSLRRDLVHRSNENRVESWTRALIDNMLVESSGWNEEEIQSLVPYDAAFLFWMVRGAEGEVLVSHGVPEGATVPFTSNERIPAGPLGAVLTKVVGENAARFVPGGDAMVVLTQPFRAAGTNHYLQVGLEESEIEGILQPFLDLFLLGVPLASLAALAAAWAISGRAVEPLVRLSHAARDVSPSRLGERIVLESTDEEVSALQRELNLALERLEAGYRSQEAFISNISHELKTPIAVLRSQSQLLLEGEHSSEEHAAFAASVEEETQRLARLVESFLTLARRGWTRTIEEVEEVAAVDVLLDAVRHSTPLAEVKGVRLSPRVDLGESDEREPVLLGDASLLETMLENLVRNAIRFSPRGGTVRVEASCRDGSVVFRVCDQGPGVPEGMQEKIFERFVGYADPAGGRGAGIGLTIAREVVELHGGEIGAQNAPGGGAVFSVVLPSAPETSAAGE